MDKNKIKSFAIWARRSLIAAVREKANRIGIYEDKIIEAIAVQGGFKLEEKEEIFSLSNSDRNTLVNQVKEKGFEQVMEEVAYTWFNRFMGLRYMEVNDYLPCGVRILSSEVEDKKEPDVLTKVSEIIDELGLNANEIYDLLDTGNTIDREKAYRIILVKQCNELGIIIPQMFEKISDYTELLLPDNLLEDGSVIRKMVEDIEESDWKEEVEIIGWMYQYYISEKKDEVFTALKKNVKITKENIPAATQLFTPKWIVKYMVENSLGRLWLEGHPNEELQKEWKYYLEEAQQEPEVEEELKKIREEHSLLKPEDIKVLDPCMGSGHILVYAFDVLYEIYKTAGYSEREIPRMILQNNLYGLDIDDRAAQLASFALIMKARSFNRRLFREIVREHLELNLCSIQESNEITDEAIDYFANGNEELKNDVKYLVDVFTDAKEYGSILEVEKVKFEALKQRLKEIEQEDNLMFGDYRKILLDKLPVIIKQAEIMIMKYEICVTNPPYMGNKGINNKLKNYIDSNYKDVKSDLFSVYIMRNLKYTRENYNLGFMTPMVWMFLSSYEELRGYITEKNSITSLVQLEYSAFEEATVPICIFTLNKSIYMNNGIYVKLSEFKGGMEIQEKKYIESTMDKYCEYKYKSNANNFSSIPGKPIAYWINSNIMRIFKNSKQLGEIAQTRQGMATSDNDRFLKLWYEVKIEKIGFEMENSKDALESNMKWFPYNKGGAFRKWYGNNEYVVNWECDGKEVKEYAAKLYKSYTRTIKNIGYYFRKGITWSMINSSKFGARYSDGGYIFDIRGSSMFFDDENIEYIILAFLSGKIASDFLKFLSPTISFEVGTIAKLPIIVPNKDSIDKIKRIVAWNIEISKYDWNTFETAWDFKVHSLSKSLIDGEQYKLSSIFTEWKGKCEEVFNQLKSNEEELNRIFIDIYGLQDELTPEVEDKDITIRKADRTRDIKSLISYAVGCMFGRYSIDAEGLIYAGRSLVSSEQCLVSSGTCKENTLTSFDEIMAKIVDEVKKNESVKLSTINSLAEVNGFSGKNICGDEEISPRRNICTYESNTESSSFNTIEHSRGTAKKVDSRISEFLINCSRFKSGSGDANNDCPAFKLCEYGRNQCNIETDRRNCKDDVCTNEQTSYCPLSTIHYLPDRDNIIPITEDEYFEDDIVSRFIEFVRTVYGNDTLEENLDFIADSIGRKASETARQAIRRYFIKDFYKDHLKVYQKRPIYWMFESGKNDGFKALIYMHRYNEQTVAKVRTDYLHTLQRKYESEVNRLQLVVDSEEYTAKDRTAAKKKIARISKQLEECREYDQVVAHFANEKISINLDDGVKVNYAKFQGVTVINSKEKEVKMNLLTKI